MMNELFPDIIRPRPEEVLSSWLRRAFLSDIDRKYYRLAMLNSVQDPDHTDSAFTYEIISSAFRHPQQCCSILLPVNDCWVSPLKYRFSYCQHCIWEDILDGYNPAFRKEWLYRWSVVCTKHSCLLSTINRYVTSNSDTTDNAASALVKNNTLSKRPYLPPLEYLLMLAGAHADCGYIYVAAHFQKWLSSQITGLYISMPTGQQVSNYHFFDMLDAISTSMMRRYSKQEKLVSQAYSYLSPRKWPSSQEDSFSPKTLSDVDLGCFEPREKAGFLAFTGILIGVPMCHLAWRLVSNKNLEFLFPDGESLFPNDHRELQNAVITKLDQTMNPLKDMVGSWFKLNLREYIGMTPDSFI
jgi:hypothetical protein